MKFNWRNPNFAFAAAITVAVVVGLFLRIYLLTDQILIDDEWHGLYYTIGKSPVWLLTHFSIPGATCIPLNFYTWAVGATVGWSETLLRVPSLMGGLLCLLIGPWLVREFVGVRRAALFGLLLAISPMLIFYSRISRPYSLVALFSLATILLAARWQRSGKRGDAVLFVIASTHAIYFHLFAVITVAAPFLVVLFVSLRARWKKGQSLVAEPPLRHWIFAGVAIAGLTSLLVLPAFIASLRSTFFKVALVGTLHWGSVPEVAVLFAGTGQPVLALLFWVAAIFGAIELCRRQVWFGAVLIILYPLHIIALVLSRPDAAQSAIVLARYCMPLVAVSLLFAAGGVFAVLEAISRKVALQPIVSLTVAACAVVTLGLAGPLPQGYVRPNNFTSHGVFQHRYGIIDWQRSFYSDLTPPGFPLVTTIRADEVSPFYRKLGESVGEGAIVEFPMPIGDHFNPLYYYQHFHRRPILVGYTTTLTNAIALPEGNIFGNTYIDEVLSRVKDSARLEFHQCVAMEDILTMRARGAEYIVIHKRFEAQLSGAVAPSTEMDRLARLYREKIGAPVYQDGFIAVWQLTK